LAEEVLKVDILSAAGVCESNIEFQGIWDKHYRELCEPLTAATCLMGDCLSPATFMANGMVCTELIARDNKTVPFSVASAFSPPAGARDSLHARYTFTIKYH
jgi:hypothetical protein